MGWSIRKLPGWLAVRWSIFSRWTYSPTGTKSSAIMVMMYDDTVAVVENRPLTGGHFLLSVHSPRQAQATRPGQFAMVRLLGRSDILLRRPMSIYDVKQAKTKAGGPASASRLRPPVQR